MWSLRNFVNHGFHIGTSLLRYAFPDQPSNEHNVRINIRTIVFVSHLIPYSETHLKVPFTEIQFHHRVIGVNGRLKPTMAHFLKKFSGFI